MPDAMNNALTYRNNDAGANSVWRVYIMPLMQSLKEQGWFVMEQHLCLRKGGEYLRQQKFVGSSVYYHAWFFVSVFKSSGDIFIVF